MAIIQYLTHIEFEFGAVTKTADIAASLGMGRPLLVTDPQLAASPLMDRMRLALGNMHYAAYTQTPQNPTEAAVEEAVAHYAANDCDGVIAFGGGSSMDLGKAIALRATHAGPLERYAAIRGGMAEIGASVAPLIAIPTTAGTGSEVGRAALITLRDGQKLGLISPHLIPRYAICDPALTLGLPPTLTAATGMDALTHCIETFLSPKVNPPAEAIALDGAARACRWIERAVAHGGDHDARWHMMMASLQGGLTFQKGLGAVHAMSHPLGAVKAPCLHHGTLNAVILPAVLRFNSSHAGDKYVALKRAMRVDDNEDLADFIVGLNSRLGLPESLRAMGVTDEIVQGALDAALADHSTATNPRPLSRGDFEELFAAAMQ